MVSFRGSSNRLNRPVRLALLLASSATVGLTNPAAAAVAVPAPDTAGNPELADIIVTATRSGAESLQKVAIPISVARPFGERTSIGGWPADA